MLAAAGYPNGFDAGSYNCDSSYSNLGEAVVNNLGEVGIRAKLRPMERAAYIKAFAEKTYKNIIQAGPAGFGNAATRLESHAVTGGTFTYGSYPDLDALFVKQAGELDYKRREAILHQMQQIVQRARDLRSDLATRLHQRRGSARRRVGLRAHPRLPLHRTLRRPGAERWLRCQAQIAAILPAERRLRFALFEGVEVSRSARAPRPQGRGAFAKDLNASQEKRRCSNAACQALSSQNVSNRTTS